MHASGIGKALLSQYPPDRLGKFLRDATLTKFTANTIIDADALRAELAISRERGFAFDDEERTTGMRCVAAPIIDVHGEVVAGISVSGPTQRMALEQLEAMSECVRKAAATLSLGVAAQQ